MTSEQAQIWNRAIKCSQDRQLRPGDQALAAVLRVHGVIMNGGLGHACSFFDRSDYFRAIEGFKFFGLVNLAGLLERAAELSEEDAEEISDEYWELDHLIESAFLHRLCEQPGDFAPA